MGIENLFIWISLWIFLGLKKSLIAFFVIVDRLTKVARFIPTTATMTTSGVAELFFEVIFVNYGLPHEIICDRDKKSVTEI